MSQTADIMTAVNGNCECRNFEPVLIVISIIYRNRWQIETFFKFLKGNLTIEALWGDSENAVKIHLWVAISTYLLLALVKEVHKSLPTII